MNLEPSPAWQVQARNVLIGSGFALLAATVYGANVPAARIASLAGIRSADVIFYRALLLAALALVVARATGTRLKLAAGEHLPMVVLAVGASLTALFYLSSTEHLPVPMAVVIFYTFPLMIMLATPLVERRALRTRQIGLFVVAFIGLVMAIGPSLAGLSSRGVLFAGLAALCNAGLFFFVGRASSSPLRALLYVQVAMAPLALIFSTAQGGLVPLSAFWIAPVAILAVVIGYAFGFYAQMQAAQRIAPARMGLLFLAEPATSILVADLVLHESLSGLQFVGVALVLGVLAAELFLSGDPA